MSRSFWTFVCGQVRGFCRGVCRLCRSVAGHAADVGHALGAEVGADHGLSSDTSQHAYTTLLTDWISEMVIGSRLVDYPHHSAAYS